MTNHTPRELQRELNARIPRGSLDQNLFRANVWLWRQQGRSFDESVTRARAHVRRQTPDFEPRLLPGE
jgi:hypothetical protein